MSNNQTNNETKKVVMYIRESTDKQVNETEGLEIQKDRIIQFCKKNNYEIVKEFSDEGVSGAKEVDERPALQNMLDYCKNPPIQFVVVDKPDRLARKFESQLFIEMDLMRNGVNILFATNETTNINENDTDMDKIMKTAMRQMMGIFAELDRKMTIKRLTDGLKKKARNGNKVNGPQNFGYKYTDDKKETVVDQEQSKIIKTMFELKKQGLSLQKIADELNNIYPNSNNDKSWTKDIVRKRLENPFYIGVVTFAKEQFKGNHEPIIDLDTWKLVNGCVPACV